MQPTVVLVTGAGRGLGWGIARGFARAGAAVCAIDIDEAELQQAAHEIAAEGSQVLTQLADVRDLAALDRCVDACVARWGRLDAVIANAAILPLIPFTELTPTDWQTILDINVTGVFNTFKAAWPQFIRQGGGHAIAIASGSSVYGFPNEVAYCASKHALEGLIKALAIEAEPHNIAVNTIGPSGHGLSIKPTSLSRSAAAALPSQWLDPIVLAPAFGWLVAQPPQRYTGLRFDAGPIIASIAAEGPEFVFAPQKVTLHPDDLIDRLKQRRSWTGQTAFDQFASERDLPL